jgi:uridylate kinase|tara:strand:+ start:6896 stop:7570 length:675 start_codon:yes stop_codon:yes gene_type:complete
MKTVVIKLSGSLFSFDKDYSQVKKITKTLDEISRNGYKVVAVAGGGKTARNMQNAARNFHADEAFLDQLGIDVSRIHAKILTTCTTNSCQDIPKTLDEVVRCLSSSKIVFTGGLSPGQSTNATAALIAERTKAKLFVNATDVDGVFTSDPRKNKNAKLIKSITTKNLLSKVVDDKMSAGTYDLMDLLSLKIIERSKIPTIVIKCDGGRIKSAISGKSKGTKITS